MLNPAFSRALDGEIGGEYVLSDQVAELVLASNIAIETGPERRLQPVYGDELWRKLEALGLGGDAVDWPSLRVVDVCAGTGFLSYHLLQRVAPRELLLIDVSDKELAMAEALVRPIASRTDLGLAVADVVQTRFPDASFDLIVGNLFLHHLWDVPQALREFRRLLAPSGSFVTLHEPTPAAPAVESGDWRLTLSVLTRGSSVLNRFRLDGPDVASSIGVDVWVFPPGDLERLALAAGFARVQARRWHLLRSLTIGRRGLHLTAGREALTPSESRSVARAGQLDGLLSHVLPARVFGSCSLRAWV